MKQFGTIFRFELKGYLKNKIFIGITVFLVALIAVVMFFPRVSEMLKGSEEPAPSEPGVSVGEDTNTNQEELPRMLIVPDVPENGALVEESFKAAFPDYQVQTMERDMDAIQSQIRSGEAECAFVLDSLTSYTYYVDNLSMYDSNAEIADAVLQSVYQTLTLAENGVSLEIAQQILSVSVSHETENLGVDQMQNFFYTYIMVFALYMVILLYGQMVATNVATEKSSRAMEVLITSAKPVSMMFGKVIASCLAGLIQLVAVFGSAFAFYNLNKSYWEGNGIVASIFDMPMDLLAYMLIFFVLGFFIYAFLYGAVGSTASKLEDINTSVMPITILFIVGFFVAMFSMSSGSVDNTLMKICSYVPFTSPMVMFTRIAMSTVPFYEIVISIVILLASVVGIGVVAAKIYRVGVLLYGTTPKLGSILKAVKKA